jgi:hypothetical protein
VSRPHLGTGGFGPIFCAGVNPFDDSFVDSARPAFAGHWRHSVHSLVIQKIEQVSKRNGNYEYLKGRK